MRSLWWQKWFRSQGTSTVSFWRAARRQRAARSSLHCFWDSWPPKNAASARISTSITLYLQQIWLYNLGVHSISQNSEKAYFQIWTEGQVGRGCEEIGSSDFCAKMIHDYSWFLRKLILVANCFCGPIAARSRTKLFALLYVYGSILCWKVVKEIDHKFSESGHSYMDSDRDFGLIE